jgi:diaminopimelate epimerase
MPFVTYKGSGNGYLLILTNKKRPGGTLRTTDEIPVAALYVLKDQIIAVSEQDFEILKEQSHIGNEKLEVYTPDKAIIKPLF